MSFSSKSPLSIILILIIIIIYCILILAGNPPEVNNIFAQNNWLTAFAFGVYIQNKTVLIGFHTALLLFEELNSITYKIKMKFAFSTIA
jgi:hypothetical protein